MDGKVKVAGVVTRAQGHADVLRQYGKQRAGFVNLHTSDLVAYGQLFHDLAANIEGLEEAAGDYREAIGDLVSRLEAAETRARELGVDAARLDWLERRGYPGQFVVHADMPGDKKWFDCETPGSDYSATLRAAIDGAMQENADG